MERYSVIFGEVKPLLISDVVVLVMAGVGVVLNGILLLITMRRRHRYWGIDSTLIATIAGLDCLASLFMGFGIVMRWAMGDSILNGMWCYVSSVVFCGSVMSTLAFTALLAVARYLFIVRHCVLSTTKWTLAAMMLLLFIFSLYLSQALTSEILVVPSGLHCTPQFWGDSFGSKAFGLTILSIMLISIFTIPFCYFKVTQSYQKLINRLDISSSIQSLTLKMYIIIMYYPTTTLPELAMAAITRSSHLVRNNIGDAIVVAASFSITLINALFTLLMHHDSKREFLLFLRRAGEKWRQLSSLNFLKP